MAYFDRMLPKIHGTTIFIIIDMELYEKLYNIIEFNDTLEQLLPWKE